MKDKVIVFIIGLLVGAILATGGFCIYENIKSSQIEQAIHSRDFKGQMLDKEGLKKEKSQDIKSNRKLDSDNCPSKPNDTNSKSNNATKSSADDQNTSPEKPADDNKPAEENKPTELNNN